MSGLSRFCHRAEHAAGQAAHPVLLRDTEARASRLQDHIADDITWFAGSVLFVYLHAIWFAAWIIFKPFGDAFPFGLLTMAVSLEAIFLSTFIMISQNRADTCLRLNSGASCSRRSAKTRRSSR